MAAHGLGPVLLVQKRPEVTFEEEHARGILALLGQHVVRGGLAGLGDGDPLLELLVVEVVEAVDGPQLCEREGGGRHASTRYWWMSDTAIEPSPTALATRLIERARTSPATKMPGTVVFRR